MMNKLPDDPDSLKKMFDLSQEQYKEGGNDAPKFTEEEVSYLLYHHNISTHYTTFFVVISRLCIPFFPCFKLTLYRQHDSGMLLMIQSFGRCLVIMSMRCKIQSIELKQRYFV